jgi:WD40 repeat protein
MALAIGLRLGLYEIVAPLGAGGMGEVYRARDTKLGRDVALKLLPATFAHDPERVARFHREAQVLASLNHPHIAAIHGVEELDGAQVLVLELVDGETLADRLRRGSLPLDEAVAIARQIADALISAHEKGIIHRDLKPANIALSSHDVVKILDFGLARALDTVDGSDPANSPTLTFHATQAGVILGTAAYMSPEQAKGRAADKRADVWAFGCVLFEMLSGRRAFEGDDVSDTLAAVLRGDANWAALPAATPSAVRALIQQCLVKDRKDRVADIAVASYVLRHQEYDQPVAAASSGGPWSRRRAVAIVAALALATGAGTIGWILRKPAGVPRTATRFAVGVPSDQVISEVVRRRHLIALAPDGSGLAYIANDQVYYRAMDALEAAPIRGSHELPTELAFSPDGRWVVYYAGGGRLKKIPITGGGPISLAELRAPYGLSWTGDRIFVGAGPRGIFEVPANGGVPTTVIEGGKGIMHGPQLLPDGQNLLFTVAGVDSGVDLWSDASIVVQSLANGRRKTLVHGGTDGRYVPSGHLLFARDGVLFANAMDADRLELLGGAVGIVDQITLSAGPTGAAHFAVSDSGSLVHLPATQGIASALAWRGHDGTDTPIPAPAHSYDMPRVAPDGRHIAVHAVDQDNDIWIWDTISQTLTRLTFDRGLDSFPLWTVDGKRVIYVSRSGGSDPNLFARTWDGAGQAVPLLAKPPDSNGALVANSVTPDGKALVYSVGTPSNIWMVSLDSTRETRALLSNPRYAERGGQVSPDGRWLAYQSDESGTFQVYVRPFPKVDEGRWQISTDGGTHALWAPNGHELYFVDTASHVVGVPVQIGASFSFGRSATVLDVADRPSSVYRNYDIAPDGSRFVVVKEPPRSRSSTQFVLTLDWFDELKKRVPVRQP